MTNAAKWHHVTAISWPNEGAEPATVKLKKTGENLEFESQGRRLVLP
jgi:hypothetical protein